ncbi:unnamed protein product, partial [Rotaria sp. Silwood2]
TMSANNNAQSSGVYLKANKRRKHSSSSSAAAAADKNQSNEETNSDVVRNKGVNFVSTTMNQSTVLMYLKKDDNSVTSMKQFFMKADDEKQWKKQNPTLMSLANELFELFLIFLSSCDIVQSLIGINERLNSLIYSFIHQIDVSKKQDQWLNKYLLSVKPLITKIKFHHAQLETLFPTTTTTTIQDQYPRLTSIIWIYESNLNSSLDVAYLNVFKTKLFSLCLSFKSNPDNNNIYNNVALLLLQDDSLIQCLTFKDNNNHSFIWLSFESSTLKLNQYLKELNIKLRYAHHLFILIRNLLKLEFLNVEICGAIKNDIYNYNNIENPTATLSPVLKHLIINSHGLTYSNLILLLKQFQQSIQLLKLDMCIQDHVNGEIITSTITSTMPKLKELQFVFRFTMNKNVNINTDEIISSFSSTSYWLNHAVMCFYEELHSYFVLLSLPWSTKENDPITNDIINYRTNTTTLPLKLMNMYSIYLNSTTIDFKFLKFIQDTFIHFKKITICWYTCSLNDDVIEQKTQINLSTIQTLKYYGISCNTNYIEFLLLLSNVRRLFAISSIIQGINRYISENEKLCSVCKQITYLHIYKNLHDYNNDEIKKTFPNAFVSLKNI